MHEGTDKRRARREGARGVTRCADGGAGAAIESRFVLERALSRGSMSIVVAARGVHGGDSVAIKYLNPEHVRDPEICGRFDREASALRRSQSEHVVRMLDVARAPALGPYIVMERLEGKDLAQLVTEAPLGPERAVSYVIQACRALAVAHGEGIVHHDVKPENLLLSHAGKDETVKLIDFGISEDTAHPEPAGGEWIIGTPAYMSPERVTGRGADPRSDIWSLGVTLHELASGRLPFTAASDAELCRRIASGQAPELETDTRLLPRGLRDIVWHCVRPEPADRYQHVSELMDALSEPAVTSRRLRGHVTGTFRRSLLGRYGAQLRERVSRRRK
jgi:eukaryotic-like serine/threonine-protein kinase